MNFSIGVDIEEISRFKKVLTNKNFLNKVFSKKEIKYCFAKKRPEEHLAARFAAKEAIIKAVSGKSRRKILLYNKIEVINDKNNAPRIIIKDVNFTKKTIKISMSHCEDKAIALAIIY